MTPGFKRGSVLAGMRASLALQLATIPFALVCGILSQAQGLSLFEAVLMSATVYAGSAQLLALGHWSHPAPILAATGAALVVNLRLALMGHVVAPWLDRIRGWRLWATLFMLVDQSWALSVTELRAGRWDAGFLFGSGALTWVVWVAGTAAGFVMGQTVRPAPGHPLFFAGLAVFIAIVAGLWQGRRDVLPWTVAAVTALVASRLLGGTWYVVLGAVAGAAAGVLRDRRA